MDKKITPGENIKNKSESSKTPSSPWMKVDEAAAYLKLDVRTLKNYMYKGLVPVCVTKTTKTRRFHKDDLDQWLLDGKIN